MSSPSHNPQPPPPPPPTTYRRNIEGEYKESNVTEENNSSSCRADSPLENIRVRIIRELRHVLLVDSSSKYDEVIEKLSKEDKKVLDNFLSFASICPMCKEENHESYLKDFFFTEDPEKLQIKEGVLRLMKRSKALNINIKAGILCCTCYKKVFRTRRQNIQRVNLRREMLVELRELFENSRL